MRPLQLSRRLLGRDWRSGELRILVFALVVAVAAVACIGLVSDRLTQAMGRESAELIGGDLVIESTRTPDPAWRERGRELGFATAMTTTLNSVIFHNEQMLLSSVKAVSENYPLRGQLRIAESTEAQGVATDEIPAPGTAWVDPRVLTRLDADIGDPVYFGATQVRITRVLRHEPDQGNSLFQMAPRVMVNEADLAKAQVLGPGSRVRYRTLFAGGDVETLRRTLAPRLGPGHELKDPLSQEGRANNALLDALEFVKTAALLAIVLAAIAIALAARRYSERHFDVSAMLRCLGARQHQITRLYLYQLALITGAALVPGCLLGWGVHWLLVASLSSVLPIELPPPGLAPLLSAAASAALLTAGFALPPVMRLARVPPLRVFRRELTPLPLSAWLVYGAAIAALVLLARVLFRDIETVLLVLTGVVAGVAVLGGGVYLLLKQLRQSRLARWPVLGRSLRNLAGHAGTSTSQILAFGLALMVMVLVAQLRTELLRDWRMQLPEDVPNYFAFNIQPADVAPFRESLRSATSRNPFYPVVRARLLKAKGEAVEPREETDSNRELNLTWTTALPDDNTIVAGTWPPRGNGLSIEREYAERLGVGLGDTLTFNSGGHQFQAKVTSLRTVVWESFSPNFFMILSQDLLADLPATYLTSFRLEGEQRRLLGRLARQFPAVTFIEVDALVARLRSILAQVTLAVETLMVFVMLGGLAILFAVIVTTADERLQEGALMRAVGASRPFLRRTFLSEFALLGLLAGTLAVLGAELARWLLYSNVFDLDFRPGLLHWVTVPPAAGLGIGLAGYLGTRRVLQVSPNRLLR